MKRKLIFTIAWFMAFPAIIHAGTYNIKDFGAVADGKTVNTASIQKAIDVCFSDGGGSVIVPAGGNIDLRGCMDEKYGIFAHDIPGFFAQYVNDLTINDFKLVWENKTLPFYTHGIEIENFKHLKTPISMVPELLIIIRLSYSLFLEPLIEFS